MLVRKFNTEANRKAWQAFLNTQGERLAVDGVIGPASIAATKRFQARYKLTADGIVGENTVSIAMANGFAGFDSSASATAPVPAKNKTVLVSAGHTNKVGYDRGVSANGLIEGHEALLIRDALSRQLRRRGYTVRQDGADGVNDPLSKALKLIAGTDIAMEFHFNAGPATASGIEVLSLPKHKESAQTIAQAIDQALSLPLRGQKGWKSDTAGQHSRLAFCRTATGGLVIETCFLTNTGDVKSYQENFEKMINCLADAVDLILTK